MTTCTYQPQLIDVQDGEKLEHVLEHGLDLLQLKDYEGARSWLYSHKGHVLVSTAKAKSQQSVNFLYALSNIPGGTIFNGQLAEAGKELTSLMHTLKYAPEHLEWMHEDLSRLYRIPGYADYKAQCGRLHGKFQMFPFMICLVEQDYDGARMALGKALPHLNEQERHDVNFALQNLAHRAQKEQRPDKLEQYIALYSAIK
jgi:hypothetical protein